MAFRGGRGGGRGYGGGYTKPEPFVEFPDDVELPKINDVTPEENLVRRSLKLQNFWKASPYYLEDNVSNKRQRTEIERFSDRNKPNTSIRRDSLAQILELKNFPLELTGGSKGWQRQPSQKKVRWNPDAEMHKLDIFEKLEQRQSQSGKDEKEKKEGENEDEDDDLGEGESEEEPSDDDYNQNVDFDDDDDDFNVVDDGEDDVY
ncbi:hypothetical protein UlMin_018589 [Ulmus minor]